MTTTSTEAEVQTAVYRVLKRDELLDAAQNARWKDLGVEEFKGDYSARPDAKQLGTRHGEGRYMFFESDKSYAPVVFMTVVADTVYRELHELREDEEEA